jgi:sugar (pentulose or hexulose) kinase
MADVFSVDVRPLKMGNAACLGAALRARHADRLSDGDDIPWSDVVQGFVEPDAPVTPIPAHVTLYAAAREHYAAFERESLTRRALIA